MSIQKKPSSSITTEFISILREEGNKAWNTCLSLNADLKYSQGIKTVIDPEFSGTPYKAEHLLLKDIVKIYTCIVEYTHKIWNFN